MKLKAIAAAVMAAPLVVACGSTEKAKTFKLEWCWCYIPCILITTLSWLTFAETLATK